VTQSWPHSRIIAHRGGGALAPENTLGALRKAKTLGFSAVEFDVMLTADRVAVLIHDETLERTTNGRGAVANTTYAELAALDAGGWLAPQFRGEHVPSFDQAAKLCAELDLWANVEIKPAAGHARTTGTLTAEIAAEIWRDSERPPLLSSFDPEALEAARDAAPQLPRGFLTDHVDSRWRASMERYTCVSLNCNQAHLTESRAREIREAGYWLLCYTVNDPGVAQRLFAWGVNAIFTDRLDLIGPDF
jgi:glycerophosphoryl diester phosphodiesterase